MKNLPVICSEQSRGGNKAVGLIELNRPECLNALNTESYNIIKARLLEWRERADVAAVILYSSNQKAFCAGGDVKNLVIETRNKGIAVAEEFFTEEYFVDRLIHHISKPIIVLADGVTMGAGLGLASGASHRIVTERSVLAMPEVHIGLFPDVGATHFLPRVPHSFGLFMGLTGTRIGADDAVALGLADYKIDSKKKNKVLADLLSMPWTDSDESNRNMLSHYFLEAFPQNQQLKTELITENLKDYFAIKGIFEKSDYASIEKRFESEKLKSHFLIDAQKKFMNASPQSRRLFFTAYQNGKNMTLNECFVTEWEMSIRSCLESEFFEGVRAVLIDKDEKPNWGSKTNPTENDTNLDRFFNSGRKNLLADKFAEFFGKV